jgi:peptidyl-prolyl cis-trans isomerase SurA
MKTIHLLFTICFLLTASVAIAQPQKVVADKILAIIGDKIILRSDIENGIANMQRENIAVPENARCMMVEQGIATKALVLQADKDSLKVEEEEIDIMLDNQIRKFISIYGSKEELERISGRTVYQLKEDYRLPFREQELGKKMRSKIIGDIRITPNEVTNYFNKIPKDSLAFYESELELNQLVVFPKASREAEDYVLERLRGYKADVEAGKKDFKTLARLYTDDPGSKSTGGEYEVNRNSTDWDPIWLSKAFTLKEGQVSTPFKTRFGFHIIQMVRRTGDDALVRHLLLIPEISSFELTAAAKKLDSIRAQIIAGTIAFSTAFNKYGDDKMASFNGGAIVNPEDGSTYLTVDKLDPQTLVAIEGLKVGEVTKVYEYTNEQGKKGLRITMLKAKTQPHRENLKDDYNRIQGRALEEKKNDILEKWFDTHIPTYFIKIDSEYNTCGNLNKWVKK